MNDYKVRMAEEYKQLKDRFDKLESIIDRYNNNTLDFKLNCSIDLLMEQLYCMKHYMRILEIRANVEGVELQ